MGLVSTAMCGPEVRASAQEVASNEGLLFLDPSCQESRLTLRGDITGQPWTMDLSNSAASLTLLIFVLLLH